MWVTLPSIPASKYPALHNATTESKPIASLLLLFLPMSFKSLTVSFHHFVCHLPCKIPFPRVSCLTYHTYSFTYPCSHMSIHLSIHSFINYNMEDVAGESQGICWLTVCIKLRKKNKPWYCNRTATFRHGWNIKNNREIVKDETGVVSQGQLIKI